ncbi:MAG TPA: histone deacetylase family protein [Candidatus Competibacteraceae bacterium]|nr:histone deacetylase family protein [Candidatus Competibacteraceae bacterium]
MSRRIRIYHHPACSAHDTGPGHPERPARLAAIAAALRQPEFATLDWQEAPLASFVQLTRVHPSAYVESVLAAIPSAGHSFLDGDTVVSPASGEAALRAAGAVCAAVEDVLAGTIDSAFCLVRPPGHHAERAQAMGFCLFNNVAVGAAHALSLDVERLAIVDFDVHHGNGTQDIFRSRPECLYISSHQSPLYPGTGYPHERGAGNILNLPLKPRSGSQEFRAAWREHGLPALQAHGPQLILISAGFDAHARDPLASLYLDEEDYAWLTGELLAVAECHAQGRIVSALEGGYDLDALAASAAAHVRALLGI